MSRRRRVGNLAAEHRGQAWGGRARPSLMEIIAGLDCLEEIVGFEAGLRDFGREIGPEARAALARRKVELQVRQVPASGRPRGHA